MSLANSSTLRLNNTVSPKLSTFSHRVCTLTRTCSEAVVGVTAAELGFPKEPNTKKLVSWGKLLPAARPFVPGAAPKAPDVLTFWGWWYEQATRPQRVCVEFHRESQTFRISSSAMFLHAPVLIRCYHTENGTPTTQLTADDLHVGSSIEVLGKKVVLKQCGTLDTLQWLDHQATTLVQLKRRLEQELSKFCFVSHTRVHMVNKNVAVQNGHYFAGYVFHDNEAPKGGKANIAGLKSDVTRLGDALQNYRWDDAAMRRLMKPLRSLSR